MSRKNDRPKRPDFIRRGAVIGAIGLISVAPPIGVSAQDAGPDDGGVIFQLRASQSIRASDNRDLEDPAVGEVFGVTSLTGSIASITRQRSFTLGFEAGVEVGSDGFELGDTGLDLAYLMRGRGSEFEVFADYLRRDVSSEVFEDIDGVGDLDLSVTTGTRTTYGYGARALIGADGPLTFALRARRSEVQFDSPDPDATDSRRFVIDGSVSAAMDAATRVRVTGSYSETDDDDALDTFETDTRAGVGITRELGNASTVSADLFWQEIRTTAGATTVESGIGGRLAFDRTLPAGSFGVSAEREITVNGTIDELRANRQFVFPASSLGLEAGIVITAGDTVSPLLGLSYERLAPDGNFAVSLTQGATVDADDETVLNTVGTAAYVRNINAVSSYRAAVAVTNQSVIGGGDTTRRIDGSLTYNRALTEDVSLATGYEHARIFETGTNERTSNTVFVTISRNFSARP